MRVRQTWIHFTFGLEGKARVRFEHLTTEPGNIKRTVGKEYVFQAGKRHKMLPLIKIIQKSQDRQYTVYAIDGYSVLIERKRGA